MRYGSNLPAEHVHMRTNDENGRGSARSTSHPDSRHSFREFMRTAASRDDHICVGRLTRGDSSSGTSDVGTSLAISTENKLRESKCTEGDGKRAGGPHYLSASKAALHIFKGNIGAGIFLLPTFYQGTGYVFGVLCAAVLSAIMLDCSLALLRAKNIINQRHVETYPTVVEAILGKTARRFTDMAILFTQFGYCVVYIQYTSILYAKLLPFTHMYATIIVLCVLLVTPFSCMSHNLSVLALTSLLAVVFVVVVLVLSTAAETGDLRHNGVAPSASAVKFTSGIWGFLAAHVFALEGIGVIMPIENSLAPDKRPHFHRLLKTCLVLIVLLCISFGLLGYLSYGDQLSSSVVFAVHSEQTKLILQCLLGLSLLFSYPIQYVPAIQIMDRLVGVSLAHERITALALRVALNTFFGLIAFHVGENTVNDMASFIGASVGVHLMMTIPALLTLKLDSVVGEDCRSTSERDVLSPSYIAAASPAPCILSQSSSQSISSCALLLTPPNTLRTQQPNNSSTSKSRKRRLAAVMGTTTQPDDHKSYNDDYDIVEALSEARWSLTDLCELKFTWRRSRWLIYIVLVQLVWAGNMYHTITSILNRNKGCAQISSENVPLSHEISSSSLPHDISSINETNNFTEA